ncbi:MAG: hypothetical protein KF832_24075 [Caldilineaceae bacterium]|nr:hypothetical protein [Caldilineaceae bacterium]
MSLETRVETLEHEFKILKNEIESTLLEIQNQILIHYYPTLRSEATPPPKEALVSVNPPMRQGETSPKASQLDRADDEPVAAPPRTKEVSLDALRGKGKKAPLLAKADAPTPRPSLGRTQPTKLAPPVLDQAALPYLAQWVNDSVTRIGKPLTQEMINASAGADDTTPAVTAELHDLLDLWEDEDAPSEVDPKAVMEVLMKLNRLLEQVARMVAETTNLREEVDGQGHHDHLHDYR